MKNTLHALSGFSLLFSSVCSSQGATVVSNLDEATNGTQNIEDPQAIRFTTGPGPGWTIDAITVRMNKTGSASENLAVDIREEVNGFPTNINSGQGFELNFSSTGTIDLTFSNIRLSNGDRATLDPNTPYWLVFAGPDGSGGGPASTTSWAFTDSADQTGWSIDHQRLQEPGGPGSGWNVAGTNSAYLFSIEATAIPEPSSLALLGLCGLGLLRRRR